MTLVQINLRRSRDPRRPGEPIAAADESPVPISGAGASPSPHASATPWLALAVGIIMLVPLAGPALHSGPTLALLLLSLGILGLIAAFLRPGAGAESP